MTATQAAPALLFARARTSAADERVFVGKLMLLAALTAGGLVLALQSSWWLTAGGVVLLAAMFTHAVELQHQALHHSAFRSARWHRWVGVPLGLPLLVVYSHYRLRHLQHHRYLGTVRDTEFFGFDTRKPLTYAVLVRGLLDYPRLGLVLRDVARAAIGRWRYEFGEVSPVVRRRIVADHLVLGVAIAGLVGVSLAGGGEYVLRLWLLPLLLAVPLHFLVELPEHVLCDTSSTDVLRNTRSIRGSRLSTWFTNGNNLHIEHHAAMTVPLQRLPERHEAAAQTGLHVERTYADFYRTLFAALRDHGGAQIGSKPAHDPTA